MDLVAPTSLPPHSRHSAPEAANSSASPQPHSTVNPDNSSKPRRGRKSLVDIPRPFSCDVCGTKFARQEHLKRHQQSLHSGARPFQCETCGKRFARRDNLKQHLGAHEREHQWQNEATLAVGYTTYGSAQLGHGGALLNPATGQKYTTTSVQQQRIAENHRRLENQGKL